jgi:hypothetical protein
MAGADEGSLMWTRFSLLLIIPQTDLVILAVTLSVGLCSKAEKAADYRLSIRTDVGSRAFSTHVV